MNKIRIFVAIAVIITLGFYVKPTKVSHVIYSKPISIAKFVHMN